MPQMSPMDWLFLSMFFLFIYFLSFLMIYFLLNLNINKKFNLMGVNFSNFSLNW